MNENPEKYPEYFAKYSKKKTSFSWFPEENNIEENNIEAAQSNDFPFFENSEKSGTEEQTGKSINDGQTAGASAGASRPSVSAAAPVSGPPNTPNVFGPDNSSASSEKSVNQYFTSLDLTNSISYAINQFKKK